MPQRNSLSGKNYLPRRPAKDGRVPAHIGEAFLALPDGDPEGSPSDPVTTDPKGEAWLFTRQAIRRPSSTKAIPREELAIVTRRSLVLRERDEVKG
jgi:hypothetical protein